MSKIHSPFTDDQVVALNRWQSRGDVHPFACPRREGLSAVVLVAHEDGWHCPACDYRQDWAHDFMAAPPQEPAE